MPNLFVPSNLRITDVLGDSAVIAWDISNAVKSRPGVRFRVYTSADGVAFTLFDSYIRQEASVPLKSASKFVKVSSYTPTLGESDKSAVLEIRGPETLAQYETPTPVAVDEAGKSRYLKTTSDGKLEVKAEFTDLILSGVSTEAKQDAVISLLTDLKSYSSPGLAKEAKQDSILLQLISQSNTLSEIRANTEVGNLTISETEMLSVTPAGSKATVLFPSRANIRQITVIQEFGIAESFSVRIWRKKVSASDRDILAKFDSYQENRLDVIKTIPYINLDGTDEITIQVIPDNGTSNNFYVRISGELAY